MVVLATTRRACASRARRGVQFAQGRAFEFCAIYRVSWAGEKSYGWVTSLLQSPQPVYEFTCRSQDNRVGITVGFVASSCSLSPNRAVLDTGANMVSRTKERAFDPLLVPALLALATPSIC